MDVHSEPSSEEEKYSKQESFAGPFTNVKVKPPEGNYKIQKSTLFYPERDVQVKEGPNEIYLVTSPVVTSEIKADDRFVNTRDLTSVKEDLPVQIKSEEMDTSVLITAVKDELLEDIKSEHLLSEEWDLPTIKSEIVDPPCTSQNIQKIISDENTSKKNSKPFPCPVCSKNKSSNVKSKNRGVSKIAKEKRKCHCRQDALLRAIDDMKENNGILPERIHGRVNESPKKRGPKPLLTKTQEVKLVDWLKTMSKCQFSLKKSDVLETVRRMIEDLKKRELFKNGNLGQTWYKNFMKRHADIVLRDEDHIDTQATPTEESIRLWFTELITFLRENKFEDILNDADRIFCCDQVAFQLCSKVRKVLAPVNSIKPGHTRKSLTVLISCMASGKVLPPLLVFPHMWPPKTIVDSMPGPWLLGRSNTGLTRKEIFFEYIGNGFNPWITDNKINKPVILFLDGFKTHMSRELSEFCEENKIILYALPPTHIMQPADVSVFRSMRHGWKETVRKWQSKPENINDSVTKYNFCSFLSEVLQENDIPDAIKRGFWNCGLYPLNADNVDYSKCMNSSQITTSDLNTTVKVIKTLEPKLTSRGINVQVILNEIQYLKEKICK